MTKASATRRERRLEARDPETEAPGSPTSDVEPDAGTSTPLPPDCSYCRRNNNCAVWLGFAEAVNSALGNAATRIPGIKLEPSLKIIDCPEFDVMPEVEAQVRKKMAIMSVPPVAEVPEATEE